MSSLSPTPTQVAGSDWRPKRMPLRDELHLRSARHPAGKASASNFHLAMTRYSQFLKSPSPRNTQQSHSHSRKYLCTEKTAHPIGRLALHCRGRPAGISPDLTQSLRADRLTRFISSIDHDTQAGEQARSITICFRTRTRTRTSTSTDDNRPSGWHAPLTHPWTTSSVSAHCSPPQEIGISNRSTSTSHLTTWYGAGEPISTEHRESLQTAHLVARLACTCRAAQCHSGFQAAHTVQSRDIRPQFVFRNSNLSSCGCGCGGPHHEMDEHRQVRTECAL